MTKLFIISNESIFSYKGKFFCDNIDMKSTPEGLNKLFEVNLISRQSKNERIHEININTTSKLSKLEIEKMTVTELQDVARSHKLKVKGKKNELMERINEFYNN